MSRFEDENKEKVITANSENLSLEFNNRQTFYRVLEYLENREDELEVFIYEY